MRDRLLIGALLLASAVASADPPASSSKLTCEGEAKAGKKAAEARARAEQTPLFSLAAQTFGAPTACSVKWEKTDDGLRSTIAFTFPQGATLAAETSPPETLVEHLSAASGLVEKSARQALEASATALQIMPKWKQPETRGNADGTVTKVYWDQDDGNGAVEMTYRGKQLVALETHLAL